jgi:hypothetical protein
MSATSYVVLVHRDETNTWAVVHKGAYRTPAAAKAAAADEHGGGSYLAVPARSWKPESYVGRQMTVWEVAPVSIAEPTG